MRGKRGFKARRRRNRVLKLARTISNLVGVPDIGLAHLAEALQYNLRRVKQRATLT